MAKNIEKIIVFGDSNCAGDELLQEDYAAEIEDILLEYGATLDTPGSVKKVKNGNMRDLQNTVNDLIFERNQRSHMAMRENQFRHSFGAQLGSLANVEVINYARGGNSNIGIYNQVVNCRVDINPNTLLLIGSTYLHRKTRLVNKPPQVKDVPYQHLQEYVTFLPGWSPHGREKDAETYRMLDIEWGDDDYFLYMSFLAQLKAMQAQLKDIPHYFLDSTGSHSTFFLRNSMPLSYREQVKLELKSILLPGSLYSVAPEIKKKSALFGHLNRNMHKLYAQELFDKFTKDNVL